MEATKTLSNERVLSLDVMRGFIMILLAAESAQVYESLHEITAGGSGEVVVRQFFHHPWNGLRFWDLVQPAFMTMAGTALYISFALKEQRGISWGKNFRHILVRCFRLLLCGVALHCVYAGKPVWELWNVLSQLAFTTLVAYLIIRQSSIVQFAVSILLLVLTEVLYRTILVPGFDQPFVDQHNFGNYMDMVLMGKINKGGWVAINCIPTAAHTIWGCLIGKLLLTDMTASKRIRLLIISGLAGLLIGYGMDWLNITPIIKRIATSSFVFASAGWVLLIAAFTYWIVDVKKKNRLAWIPQVVGMNSIFIYLVFESSLGYQWVNTTIGIFSNGLAGALGTPELWQHLFTAIVVLIFYWALCYWLYRRKIFFKL
jgi:predicted acyltransferase